MTHISQCPQLDPDHQDRLEQVTRQFPFRCSDYYLSLIHWDDPDDPIRRMIIPDVHEIEPWGDLDPSDEEAYTVLPGLEHKYKATVLVLTSNVCAGICRYCFRKRMFMTPHEEVLRDIPAAVAYIKAHDEISNVLISGGDPLMLSTSRLEALIRPLSKIDHVRIIRLGTKVPAFNPYRIIEDDGLLHMISQYNHPDRKIYVMTHFSHTRELTDQAVDAVVALQRAGTILSNQTPLIRKVNDQPDELAALLQRLSFVGIAPYYIFQCRPTWGNRSYTVPIEEGCEILRLAKSQISGLAKRIRYVMSHKTGKIEILGVVNGQVMFKYHETVAVENEGQLFTYPSCPQAYWLDDYEVNVDSTISTISQIRSS